MWRFITCDWLESLGQDWFSSATTLPRTTNPCPRSLDTHPNPVSIGPNSAEIPTPGPRCGSVLQAEMGEVGAIGHGGIRFFLLPLGPQLWEQNYTQYKSSGTLTFPNNFGSTQLFHKTILINASYFFNTPVGAKLSTYSFQN